MISEYELNEIELRCSLTKPGPWKAYIKGRDFDSGESIIKTGNINYYEGEDIELFGASEHDLEFMANAKQDIPKLIATIRELMKIK